MTLELSNVANLPIAIYPGMKIGQLSFVQLSEAAERPYGSEGIGSKYKVSAARRRAATGRTSRRRGLGVRIAIAQSDPPIREIADRLQLLLAEVLREELIHLRDMTWMLRATSRAPRRSRPHGRRADRSRRSRARRARLLEPVEQASDPGCSEEHLLCEIHSTQSAVGRSGEA